MNFLKKFKKTITVLVVTSVLTAMYVASVYGSAYVFFMGTHTTIDANNQFYADGLRFNGGQHQGMLQKINVLRNGEMRIITQKQNFGFWSNRIVYKIDNVTTRPMINYSFITSVRAPGLYSYSLGAEDASGYDTNARAIFNNFYARIK